MNSNSRRKELPPRRPIEVGDFVILRPSGECTCRWPLGSWLAQHGFFTGHHPDDYGKLAYVVSTDDAVFERFGHTFRVHTERFAMADSLLGSNYTSSKNLHYCAAELELLHGPPEGWDERFDPTAYIYGHTNLAKLQEIQHAIMRSQRPTEPFPEFASEALHGGREKNR